MTDREDYYSILEISNKSSQEEIKKAYRKLSLKYHPDKTNGDPELTKKFQKINEAYETLGNNEKRNSYDTNLRNPFFSENAEMPNNADIHEMFNNIFFGGMQGMQGISMPPEMAFFGGGGGGPGGVFPSNIKIVHNGIPINIFQQIHKPTPIITNVTINMSQVINGANIPLEIERWIIENDNKVFEKVTLYVKIEKGIDNNEIIIIHNEGNIINPNCKGDVKIFVKIENDTELKREGLNLIYNKTISLKDALCGFSFELKHVNDKIYTIHNQAGNIIYPEFKKVIQNMGLVRENSTGSLIIHFHIEFPKTLDIEKINVLRELL